eukprot:12965484-Alexandrium_andersonii.AAC.1
MARGAIKAIKRENPLKCAHQPFEQASTSRELLFTDREGRRDWLAPAHPRAQGRSSRPRPEWAWLRCS